ncbi:helix-turn-helix domain-containing protein [Saccharothrix sp.]|uniref:TetR/AcrR family transcriptional regulator n=1 Tax=Saccharothrix sp. TaxID=1873460 RepID=UPI0028114FA1|nr:helix-turn-helix domain-containing protein [Saccharothrix sp.]
MSSPPETGLPGRRRQAAQNDQVILDAAREVFMADPKAPIAAVAKRAGVGISALYRRYPGKEDMLRKLCHDGLRRYIAEAEAALEEPDAWAAFAGFLDRVVDADVHSLTVHLAGTFTPTPEMFEDSRRAARLAAALVDRARSSGRLRPDAVVEDLGLVLESCAAIRLPDAERTRELRRRVLTMMVESLGRTGEPDLPGPPPHAGDFAWRWQPRESSVD